MRLICSLIQAALLMCGYVSAAAQTTFTLHAVSLFNPKPLMGISSPIVTPTAKHPQWHDYAFTLPAGWGCEAHAGKRGASVHCALYGSSVTGYKPEPMGLVKVKPGDACVANSNSGSDLSQTTNFSIVCKDREAIAAMTPSGAR